MSTRRLKALLVGLLMMTGMANAVPVYAQSSPMQTTSGVVFVRGMLGPFFLADGTTAAPGQTFASQTDLGWYRAGTGDVRFSIGSSADQWRETASNLFFRSNENIGWSSTADPAGAPGTWLSQPATGAVLFTANAAAFQLRTTQTTVPTVTNGGGTGPVCVGTDTIMSCTIGSAPPVQTTFTVTFNGTWAAAPSCTGQRGTTGTTPVTTGLVTTTTTIVVNLSANVVASEKWHIHCGGVQ